MTFQELLKITDKGQLFSVSIMLYGTQFSTEHVAEYFLKNENEEVRRLGEKKVSVMWVKDGILAVTLK